MYTTHLSFLNKNLIQGRKNSDTKYANLHIKQLFCLSIPVGYVFIFLYGKICGIIVFNLNDMALS